MSLTGTTTRERFRNSKPFPVKGIAALVAGVVIAGWIGFAITGTETQDTVGTMSSNSLTHEEFVRLNTTDLPVLPAVRPALEPAAQTAAGPNTGTAGNVNDDHAAHLLSINTGALDGSEAAGDEPSRIRSGPR